MDKVFGPNIRVILDRQVIPRTNFNEGIIGTLGFGHGTVRAMSNGKASRTQWGKLKPT